MSQEALTAQVTYLFLDIVGFTYQRSVEAQSEIIGVLNDIVRAAVTEYYDGGEVIYLPTGDGICIGLLYNDKLPYDTYMKIAIKIINDISEHNGNVNEEEKKFFTRIGINSNKDNLIIDINKNTNLAGTGINTASRIMNTADENQIIVGASIYNELQHRKQYMNSFKEYIALVKHNLKLPVYQYVNSNHNGLNVDTPKIFKPKTKEYTKFNRTVAYYCIFLIKHKNFISSKKDAIGRDETVIILFWLLAMDEETKYQERDSIDTMLIRTYQGKSDQILTIDDQFEYYSKLEYMLRSVLSHLIEDHYLGNYRIFFDSFRCISVNKSGITKLRKDFPEIWNEFFPEDLIVLDNADNE